MKVNCTFDERAGKKEDEEKKRPCMQKIFEEDREVVTRTASYRRVREEKERGNKLRGKKLRERS